jgi:hypothetical protein
MAVPAPAVPSGNAYTVHVAAPGDLAPLAGFAAAASLLLRRRKIPVRVHLAGDSPRVTALRALLADAGARASAFSPAPSAAIPGEGFWKTTVTVVEAKGRNAPEGNFWAEERDDRKVEWDPLLVALREAGIPADLPPDHVARPDLWCVAAAGDAAAHAALWMQAGAAAVCVLAPGGIAWKSDSAVFGKSEGARSGLAGAGLPAPLGPFSAGVVSGLLGELLEENLFEKTLIRADRACLEMRPLRLGRACLAGVAAVEVTAEENGLASQEANGPAFLRKDSEFVKRVEQHLALLRGPEARPWGTFGRKERS